MDQEQLVPNYSLNNHTFFQRTFLTHTANNFVISRRVCFGNVSIFERYFTRSHRFPTITTLIMYTLVGTIKCQQTHSSRYLEAVLYLSSTL